MPVDTMQLQLLSIRLEKTKRRLKQSYYEFFKYFWEVLNTEQLIDNWHIEKLCNELQELSYYIVKRLPKPYDIIINIPPGTSKSSITTIFYPVWLWLQDPSLVIITSSNSAELARDHSVKSKDIVISKEFQLLYCNEITLRYDKKNKANWGNTAGGERIATSTNSSIIGRHAHVIIIDDGMTDKMASSEKLRKTALLYNNRTLSTRKKDKRNTPTIVVEQRLHEQDTSGYMLAKNSKNIKHICLPGKLSESVCPPEWKSYYENGLLDVIRLNDQVLKEMYETLGSYGFAGQVMQAPAPAEGGLLKKHWFSIIETADAPPLSDVCMFIDSAYTDAKTNDPTGIDIFGINGTQIYWIYSEDVYMEFPELIKHIVKTANDYNFSYKNKIFIEPKASGKSVKQTIERNTRLSIIEIKGKFVNFGKIGRATDISPTCETGRVKIISAPWNGATIEQVCMFPNAAHDEHVDNLCYAVNYYISERKKTFRV